MDQELLVRQIMQEVLKNMQGVNASSAAAEGKVTVADYPIGENKPELIQSASGKSLDYHPIFSFLLYLYFLFVQIIFEYHFLIDLYHQLILKYFDNIDQYLLLDVQTYHLIHL